MRQILANALSLLLAYLLPRVCMFGAVVVAARVLGAREFGAYGTAAAYAVILSILATLGMMPLLIRDMARSPERAPAIIRAAHLVKTASNALMLVAVVAIARWLFQYPDSVVIASLLLGISYAIGAYAENLAAYFQAVERMQVWTQASAVFGIVTGALGTILVLATSSVVWFCFASVVGQAAALTWLLVRTPAPVRFGGRTSKADVERLLRALLPFAAAFVALTIYYKMDVLLLARWRTQAEVGIYAAAYKFVDIAQALALVAMAAVYPRLSRLAPQTGRERRGRGAGEAKAGGDGQWAAARVIELMMLAAVPVAAVLWLVRAPLIHGLYGPAYAASAPVLAILAPVIAPLALNILAGFVFGAAGKMLPVAAAYGLSVLVNVGLNAVLIPRFGPEGAALAMLASESALVVLLLAMLRVEAAVGPSVRALRAAAGAAAACAIFSWLPDPSGGVLLAAVYVVTVAFFYAWQDVVPLSERQVLWRAIGLRGP